MFFVPGVVRGQGSLTLWRADDGTERVKHPQSTIAWRNIVIATLRREWAGRPPIRGPVAVTLVALYGRPLAHLGTGRNAGMLKPSAPVLKTGAPDLDKVIRGIGDALTQSGVLADDNLIAVWAAHARWADLDQTPGARITVREL